jgi:general secretion pathway protein A
MPASRLCRLYLIARIGDREAERIGMSAEGQRPDEASNAFASSHPGFFVGATQDEALARLGYLADTGLRCGLVTGRAGTGKSAVLRRFADERRTDCCTVVLLDLTGLGEADLLRGLIEGLGITVHAPFRRDALWLELIDGLRGRGLAQQTCLLILDHFDRALPEAHQVVRRLLAEQSGPCAATFILAFSGSSFPIVAREWRQTADLRIELAPLTAEETALFLRLSLDALGLPGDAFDPDAARMVFHSTGGVPRDIARVFERALLAAQHDDRRQVSSDIVEAALDELSLLRPPA